MDLKEIKIFYKHFLKRFLKKWHSLRWLKLFLQTTELSFLELVYISKFSGDLRKKSHLKNVNKSSIKNT